MSDVFTSAGTTLHVCASAPATYTQSGYEALSWTEVGEISDMGEFGRTYAKVEFKPLGDRAVVKRKGSYDEGALSLTLGRVPSDAGQAIMLAARDSDDSYSFKVTLNDSGTTSATTMYCTGQVMSYTTSVGQVDSVTTATCSVEFDRAFIEVAAV